MNKHRDLAIAIVREVRSQEGLDPTATIDDKLIDNISQRVDAHFGELINQAMEIMQKWMKFMAENPEYVKSLNMTNIELAS